MFRDLKRLLAMKIKLQGFRGFSNDADFIDLSDINIFIGKNSSGKSTLIKFLKTLSIAFSEVSDFDSLIGLKLNLATNLLGGDTHVKHNEVTKYIDFSVESTFDYYNGDHEIKFRFKIMNDETLVLNSISIHDEDDGIWIQSLFENNPLMEKGFDFYRPFDGIIKFQKGRTTTNIKRLYNKYMNQLPIHNLCEINGYLKNPNIKRIEENIKLETYKRELMNKFRISSDDLKELEKSHYYFHNYNFDFQIQPVNTENKVFLREEYSDEEYIDFTVLNGIETDFNFTKSFIDDLIEAHFERTDEIVEDDFLLEILSENPHLDKYSLVEKIKDYNLELYTIEFFLDLKSDLIKAKLNINHEDSSTIRELGKLILIQYSDIISPLVNDSISIFQNRIMLHVKDISSLQFIHSNLIQSERKFNLYDKTNLISEFITWYKHKKNIKINGDYNLDGSIIEAKTISFYVLNFLKKYLILFGIGKSIEVLQKENLGAIRVYKSNGYFDLVDEGSGSNRLLTILLRISMLIDYNEEREKSVYRHNYKFFIFEEPERNLHPDLQAKLAHLFVDLQNNYGVKCLIETHSEYLVRKLQILVAKNEIAPSSINIQYVTLDKDINIRKITIANDGELSSEFDTGFFDVSEGTTQLLYNQLQNQN